MATAESSKFAGISSAALSQHHLLGFEIAQLENLLNPCLVLSVLCAPCHVILPSAVQQVFHPSWAIGLEKVSFHSNPKERQCQRILKLLHNCTHLTR